RDGTGWIIYAKKGTRHYLGSKPLATNPSRLVRPGAGATFDDTFKWMIDDVIDVHGNRMEHLYTAFPDSPGNTYCSEIRYSIFGANYHAIAFDYEQRADAFTSFLSGFSVRTGRRCHQIRVTSQGALVRRYKLGYTLPADDPIEPIGLNDGGQMFSMLRQVTQFDNGVTDNNYLPPLRLGYTRFDAANVTRGSFISPAPASLGNANVTITDINGDSLPDFFYTDPVNSQHSVVYNYGLGRFSAQTTFTSQPSGLILGQGNTELSDLDGDGRIDFVLKAGGSSGVFSVFPNTTLAMNHDDTHPSWGAEQRATRARCRALISPMPTCVRLI
ncbi:MAG: FG-GAP-like repeat-containing protein, partial [Roseimicrobium sp.]